MKRVTSENPSSSATNTVSDRVIQAVADCDGISPLEVSPTLFETVDPDALNRLYADGRSGTIVTFEYAGYRVSVGGDGQVDLAPLAD